MVAQCRPQLGGPTLGAEAMTESQPMIYHIVIESAFRSQLEGPVYLPSGLSDDGFVHCALEPSVVPGAPSSMTLSPRSGHPLGGSTLRMGVQNGKPTSKEVH
jgi:hypothetical protein